MAESITRISNQPSFAANDLGPAAPQGQTAKPLESNESSFLELVVNNLPDVPVPNRPLSRADHHMARRRVFENLVSSTLEQPGHPYGRLSGRIKEDMIAAITEELVNSHYKG